ncbi:MAG: ferritin family protein [Chromatiales bacterium]|nr:ferritin family protein [Chromatiales bacterium]
MSEEHPEGTGRERLENSTTIGEVLEVAMGFEATARDFYASLAGRVSKPLRGLVQELAEEEKRHYQLFSDLRERPDVQEKISEKIERPANDHRFSDYVQLPELGDYPDDQSILQYAMGREHAAMEQYGSLAEQAPAGPIQDLFRFLAIEEMEHKGELEKRWYELVYPSNV